MSATSARLGTLLPWRVPAILDRLASSSLAPGPIDRDLPVTVDPRTTLPGASRVLAGATIPIVALTAGGWMGPGFFVRDVIGLLIAYGLATFLTTSTRAERFGGPWPTAILGIQLLFVVSLTTLTGGGASPYFALYAPILAIAGWHLRPLAMVATIGAVALLEAWRAIAVDRAGDFDQVIIGLPFFAAVGLLALLTSRRLTVALLTIRQDQASTAATLAAVHDLAADVAVDPLPEAARAAERVFGASVNVLTIEPAVARVAEPGRALDDAAGLTVPITGSTTTYALLHLERAVPFSTTERRLIGILAGAAGRALDAHRLFADLRHAAERDALTGLRNRRHLERDMTDSVMPALRAGRAVSIAYVDIDGLKAINDTVGHEAGDGVIRRAARTLSSAVRADDRVYRVGGDEFVVVAFDLDVADSDRLLDRLKSAPSTGPRRAGDEAATELRLSVGMARGAGPQASADQLLWAADRAMYQLRAARRRTGSGPTGPSDATSGPDLEGPG